MGKVGIIIYGENYLTLMNLSNFKITSLTNITTLD